MSELALKTALIDNLEPLYSILADRLPDEYALYPEQETDPWRRKICDQWSKLVYPVAKTTLQAYDLGEVERIACSPDRKFNTQSGVYSDTEGVSFGHYHEYLVDRTDPDDPLIIDGTWQQFGDAATLEDAPHIMVARTSEVATVTGAAGLDPKYNFQWRPDPGYWGQPKGTKYWGIFYAPMEP